MSWDQTRDPSLQFVGIVFIYGLSKPNTLTLLMSVNLLPVYLNEGFVSLMHSANSRQIYCTVSAEAPAPYCRTDLMI